MLSREHLKLMKKINSKGIIRDTQPNKDLDYLYNAGYIEITVCDKPDDYFAQPYLTEKGKAKLYEKQKETVLKTIPIVISLISLTKSFLPEIISLWELLSNIIVP